MGHVFQRNYRGLQKTFNVMLQLDLHVCSQALAQIPPHTRQMLKKAMQVEAGLGPFFFLPKQENRYVNKN
jgi:hypothetical protein